MDYLKEQLENMKQAIDAAHYEMTTALNVDAHRASLITDTLQFRLEKIVDAAMRLDCQENGW